MKKTVFIMCPYCGHQQPIDQDSTIFYGAVQKLIDCQDSKCLKMFVYEIEMHIDVVSWKIQGQDWDPGKKIDPAAEPKTPPPEKTRPAAISKKVAADHKKPAVKILKPAKLKLKPKARLMGKPVVAMDLLDWITTNNFRESYARGFIAADVYRYCTFARKAGPVILALAELIDLGHIVKIPEKMKSCRAKGSGTTGYRVSFNFARQAAKIIKEKEVDNKTSKVNGSQKKTSKAPKRNKIPEQYDNSRRPNRLGAHDMSNPNYVQSTPKE